MVNFFKKRKRKKEKEFYLLVLLVLTPYLELLLHPKNDFKNIISKHSSFADNKFYTKEFVKFPL